MAAVPHRSLPLALPVIALVLLLSLLPVSLAAQPPTPPFPGTVLESANVRSGPGTTYARVDLLPAGAAVQVRQCNADCTWYLIGDQRWVFAALIAPAPQAVPTAAQRPSSTLGGVSLAAVDPAAIVLVTWNVGLDDADLDEIAAQIADFDGVDLWTLQEARGRNVAAVLVAAAEEGEGAAFASVLGTTGADIRLLTLYDADRFDLLDTQELHAINTTGNARAPLVLHLRDRVTGVEFLLMNNHLYRSREDERDRQAALLAEWAALQTLPVLNGGDHNLDYDVPDGPEPADRGFAHMTADGVWEWVRPAVLAPTQCTDRLPCTYDDILDFVFVAGPARSWPGESRIIVRPGDQPDNAMISDHRPVAAIFRPTGAGRPALLPTPTPRPLPAATSAPAGAFAANTANLRSGPGTEHAVVGSAAQGAALSITGRNAAGDWLQLSSGAWIAAFLVSGAPPNVPVVAAPPNVPPTATPPAMRTNPTPVPVQPRAQSCDPSYPTVCIPPYPPDLDCGDIGYRRFQVVGSDPHRFDGDDDGIGCEGG